MLRWESRTELCKALLLVVSVKNWLIAAKKLPELVPVQSPTVQVGKSFAKQVRPAPASSKCCKQFMFPSPGSSGKRRLPGAQSKGDGRGGSSCFIAKVGERQELKQELVATYNRKKMSLPVVPEMGKIGCENS